MESQVSDFTVCMDASKLSYLTDSWKHKLYIASNRKGFSSRITMAQIEDKVQRGGVEKSDLLMYLTEQHSKAFLNLRNFKM